MLLNMYVKELDINETISYLIQVNKTKNPRKCQRIYGNYNYILHNFFSFLFMI